MRPTKDFSHEEQVRRRRDGSIDIDFYRRRAHMLRSEIVLQTLVAIWRAVTTPVGAFTTGLRSFRHAIRQAPCVTKRGTADTPVALGLERHPRRL